MRATALAGLLLVACDMLNPEAQAAKEAVKQYELVKKNGSAIERCTYAQIVVASYVQAKDEANHVKWKQVEAEECAAAGVPR